MVVPLRVEKEVDEGEKTYRKSLRSLYTGTVFRGGRDWSLREERKNKKKKDKRGNLFDESNHYCSCSSFYRIIFLLINLQNTSATCLSFLTNFPHGIIQLDKSQWGGCVDLAYEILGNVPSRKSFWSCNASNSKVVWAITMAMLCLMEPQFR